MSHDSRAVTNIFVQKARDVRRLLIPHDSRAIANIFVQKAREAQRRLTIMPLVKYVYFAHGWTLGNTGKPLIKHKVEAWKYGPVIPEVYSAFRPQGFIISEFAEDDKEKKYEADNLSQDEEDIIDAVYKQYSVMPSFTLSEITHLPDSPWSKYRGISYRTIPNDEILDYYKKLVEKINNE